MNTSFINHCFFNIKYEITQAVNAGDIKTAEEVVSYVKGYLSCLNSHRLDEHYSLKREDIERLLVWAQDYFSSPYYFEFDDRGTLPYSEGYLIVMASSMDEAVDKFQDKHPNYGPGRKIYSWSHRYTEEEWNDVLKMGLFVGVKPHEIIR